MIALLLNVTSADAHSWYPRECCSDQHCFPVPCNELHNSMSGVEWHHRVFGGREIKTSQDQACHVCVIVDWVITDQQRVSEACDLRWDDIDLRTHTIIVRRLKGSTDSAHY